MSDTVTWFFAGVGASLVILLFDWLYGDRLVGRVLWWRNTVVRVVRVGEDDHPQVRAKVIIGGQGRRFTNEKGEAKFYLPREDIYAIVVETADGKYPGGTMTAHMEPHARYLYSLNDKGARRFEKDAPGSKSGLEP